MLSEFFSVMQEQSLPFEQMFFDFNSKRVLHKPAHYPRSLLQKLEKFEVMRKDVLEHDYFKGSLPCTLLIDEIEAIWKTISDTNDWSAFESKLQAIRSFRGIY